MNRLVAVETMLDMPEPDHKENRGWWVYILESAEKPLTYTGVTTDLERRVRQHNGQIKGGAATTRRGRPWYVIHKEGPMTRSAAMSRELQVKGWSREQKLALAGRVVSRET